MIAILRWHVRCNQNPFWRNLRSIACKKVLMQIPQNGSLWFGFSSKRLWEQLSFLTSTAFLGFHVQSVLVVNQKTQMNNHHKSNDNLTILCGRMYIQSQYLIAHLKKNFIFTKMHFRIHLLRYYTHQYTHTHTHTNTHISQNKDAIRIWNMTIFRYIIRQQPRRTHVSENITIDLWHPKK